MTPRFCLEIRRRDGEDDARYSTVHVFGVFGLKVSERERLYHDARTGETTKRGGVTNTISSATSHRGSRPEGRPDQAPIVGRVRQRRCRTHTKEQTGAEQRGLPSGSYLGSSLTERKHRGDSGPDC